MRLQKSHQEMKFPYTTLVLAKSLTISNTMTCLNCSVCQLLYCGLFTIVNSAIPILDGPVNFNRMKLTKHPVNWFAMVDKLHFLKSILLFGLMPKPVIASPWLTSSNYFSANRRLSAVAGGFIMLWSIIKPSFLAYFQRNTHWQLLLSTMYTKVTFMQDSVPQLLHSDRRSIGFPQLGKLWSPCYENA